MNHSLSKEAFKIAITFAGTLIGAGFASGQELMQFFAYYGPAGLVGIGLSALLLCLLGAKLLCISHRQQFTSYHQLLYYVCGQKIGMLLDIAAGLCLLAEFTVMLAGLGTVGSECFDTTYVNSMLFGIIALTATLTFGIRGITTVNLFCTPLLACIMIVVSISSLTYHSELTLLAPLHLTMWFPKPSPYWLIASLLYVAYNLVIASTVITPIGAQAKHHQACIWGGIGGGLLLGLLALFVTAVILLHQPEIFLSQLPMLYVAAQQNPLAYALYCGGLLIAMFTTACASLYGCITKLASITNANYYLNLFAILLLGLVLSHVGFSKLIAAIYPLFGYIAAWFMLKLLWFFLRDIGSH